MRYEAPGPNAATTAPKYCYFRILIFFKISILKYNIFAKNRNKCDINGGIPTNCKSLFLHKLLTGPSLLNADYKISIDQWNFVASNEKWC